MKFKLIILDTIGKRLKYLLKVFDLTAKQFGKDAQISQSTITRIMSKSNVNKKRLPNLDTLQTLSNYFGIPVKFFTNGIIDCPRCKFEINVIDFIEEINFNNKCPKCNKRLYRIMGLYFSHKDYKYTMIAPQDILELNKMIKEYRWLFENIKGKVSDTKKRGLGEMSFEEFKIYKEQLDLKKDTHNTIEVLINKYNESLRDIDI